jgi:pimeloyl-ACP methyl ester carboxylesterase
MDHTALTLQLPDGRSLGYALYGSSLPTAHQIVYLHAFPTCRIEGAILASHALALNIRLICPDRPGFGLSTPHPGRTVLDFPEDILCLVNYLQIGTFSIVAYSAATPYALACVRVIPAGRLRGVDIAAPIFRPETTPAQKVYNTMFMPMVYAAKTGFLHLASASLNSQFGSLARDPDPTKFYAACRKDLQMRPAIERTAMEGIEQVVLWDPMREAMRGAVKGSGEGKELVLEMKLQVGHWRLGLTRGGWENVTLWQGGQDELCPLACVSTAEMKMRCQLKVLEGQGHIGVLVYFGRAILENSLTKLGGTSGREDKGTFD